MPRAKTLSVPLHRGMTCGARLSPPKQGDLGGLHIIRCANTTEEKKTLFKGRKKLRRIASESQLFILEIACGKKSLRKF